MLRNHFLAHKFIHFTILSSSSSDNIYFQFERLRILLKQDHVPPVVDRGVAQKALNDFKARPPRKHRKSHGQISFLNLSKTVSARWNALDPQLQQPFRDVAKVEAVHRQKLYQEWKAKYGGQQPHEEASDESEDCEDSDDDENPQGSASLVARRTETKTKKKNKKLEIGVVKEVDAATPPSGVLQSSKTSSFQSQTKQSEMRNSSLSLANEGILHHGSSFPQQEETMRGMVVKSRPVACTTPVHHHRQHEVATYNKTKSLYAATASSHGYFDFADFAKVSSPPPSHASQASITSFPHCLLSAKQASRRNDKKNLRRHSVCSFVLQLSLVNASSTQETNREKVIRLFDSSPLTISASWQK